MKSVSLKIGHLRNSDFSELWKFVSSKNVTKYLTWRSYKKKSQLVDYLKKAKPKKGYPDEILGIYLNNKLIGTIHLISRGNNKLQFGFGLIEDYWNKGYATRACLIALKYIKKNWITNKLKLEVWTDIHKKNISGRRVIEKLGFKLGKLSVEPNRDRYTFILNRKMVHTKNYNIIRKKHILLKKLIKSLSSNERVSLIFLTGSTANKKWNEFSDIDFWVVVKEEKYLNSIIKEVNSILNSIGDIQGIYKCTEQHYFYIFKDLEILDLNFITSAQYFSITTKEKRFLSLNKKKNIKIKNNITFFSDEINELILKGYSGLFRTISKAKNKEWWLVPRFINSVRESAILPLLALTYNYKISNLIEVKLSSFDGLHRNLLKNTFVKPDREEALEGIKSSHILMKIILSDLRKKHNLSKIRQFIEKADREIQVYYEK